MYPDGGIARLRVHGEPLPDPRLFPESDLDLAALAHGGWITGCSNMFYSLPSNLIAPGPARVMNEGWETARRRDDGNDWVELRLAAPGTIRLAEIDTSYFVGNAPGWASLSGYDARMEERTPVELLPKTRLQPDTVHLLPVVSQPEVTHVRIDVYPDGGLARLRLLGQLSPDAREQMALRWFNLLPASQAALVLLTVCHSNRWATAVVESRPFAGLSALQGVADVVWAGLGPDDWREALDGHPRIGEQGGSSRDFSAQEQSGLSGASADVTTAIAQGNRDYEQRFGHIFLISAAGRSPEEILANLNTRLANDPETELRVAADQHRRITRLRLEKLFA